MSVTNEFMKLVECIAFQMPQQHHDPRFGHPMAKPGGYVSSLSADTRKQLGELRSDDIVNVRVDKIIF